MGQLTSGNIIVGQSSTDGSGTTGDEKRGTGIAILAVGTIITFAVAYSSANYSLPPPRCYDAGGNNIDFTITNKIAAGFTITPAIDCSMDYVCRKI